MKAYFTTICKYLQYFASAFLMLLIQGCHPGYILPRNVDMFTEKSIHSYYGNGSLVILPFDSAEMKPDLGIAAGRIFEAEINKKKRLRQVSLREDVSWEKQIPERELKVRAALAAAKEHNADLLLWGSIEDFLPGTATETVLTLNVMLISVSEGKILWWGRDKAVGKPGNAFLFAGQSISPNPPSVDRLLSSSAQRIVNAMFPDTNGVRPIQYLRQMIWRLFSRQHASENAAHEVQPVESELSQSMESTADVQGASADQPAEQTRDIMDMAIEELDATD